MPTTSSRGVCRPALGTRNLQRNSIVGPGNKSVDLSLVQRFGSGRGSSKRAPKPSSRSLVQSGLTRR
jgi:hypothetical protein